MHLSTLIVTSLTAAGSASAFHWGTSAPSAGFGAAAAATDAVAPAPACFSGPPPSGPSPAPAPGAPAGGARRPAQAAAAAIDASEEDGVVAVTDIADEGDDADAVTITAEDESDCEEKGEESDDEGDGVAPVVASSTTIDCPIPTNFIWNGAPIVVTASTVLTLPCTTDAAGATVSLFFFFLLLFHLFFSLPSIISPALIIYSYKQILTNPSFHRYLGCSLPPTPRSSSSWPSRPLICLGCSHLRFRRPGPELVLYALRLVRHPDRRGHGYCYGSRHPSHSR